jgi:RNA 3'-terminal phosphate cyclase (ATP)
LQDQLVIFMAVASGTSSVLCGDLTLHTRTAIAVVQQLLPEAEVTITQITGAEAGAGGSSGSYSCSSSSSSSNPGKVLYMVRCRGAGLVAV